MAEKKDDNKRKSKKEYEVVTGNGKDLDISPVYDHIKIGENSHKNNNKKVIVTKGKK